MQVLILDGLGNPTTVKASRVVIATDSGTPVAMSVELLPGLIDSSNCEDDDFNVKLRMHGIDRSVQVDTLRAPKIADFDIRI